MKSSYFARDEIGEQQAAKDFNFASEIRRSAPLPAC